jgi:hypothetical protein
VSLLKQGRSVRLRKEQSAEALISQFLSANAEATERRESAAPILESTEIKEVVVLICGHGGRDRRCGAMGPLLQTEFEGKLARAGFMASSKAPGFHVQHSSLSDTDHKQIACIGLISHIGLSVPLQPASPH